MLCTSALPVDREDPDGFESAFCCISFCPSMSHAHSHSLSLKYWTHKSRWHDDAGSRSLHGGKDIMGLMQHHDLTISGLMDHGSETYSTQEIVSRTVEDPSVFHRYTFSDCTSRSKQVDIKSHAISLHAWCRSHKFSRLPRSPTLLPNLGWGKENVQRQLPGTGETRVRACVVVLVAVTMVVMVTSQSITGTGTLSCTTACQARVPCSTR